MSGHCWCEVSLSFATEDQTNKQIHLGKDLYPHTLYNNLQSHTKAWLWLEAGSNTTEQIHSTEGPFKYYVSSYTSIKKRSPITTNRTNLSNFLNPVIFSPDRINICQNGPLIYAAWWIIECVKEVIVLAIVFSKAKHDPRLWDHLWKILLLSEMIFSLTSERWKAHMIKHQKESLLHYCKGSKGSYSAEFLFISTATQTYKKWRHMSRNFTYRRMQMFVLFSASF